MKNKILRYLIVLITFSTCLFLILNGEFYLASSEYKMYDKNNKIVNADFMEGKGLLMFQLPNQKCIVSILDSSYVGINDGTPFKLGKLFYFKNSHLMVNIDQAKVKMKKDTTVLSYIQFYDFKLGNDERDSFKIFKVN